MSHCTVLRPYTRLHTRLTALFPELPRWAGTRKVKPVWILLKQETVSGSGISWAICKSAPRSRQPCQQPTTQFFTGRMPFLPPNQQRQSTEGIRPFTWWAKHRVQLLFPLHILWATRGIVFHLSIHRCMRACPSTSSSMNITWTFDFLFCLLPVMVRARNSSNIAPCLDWQPPVHHWNDGSLCASMSLCLVHHQTTGNISSD